MKIHLKKLCPSDGDDIYEMLQEFPENENGFITPALTSIDAYKSWLAAIRIFRAFQRYGIISSGSGAFSWWETGCS
jgi:hypothetical protein